MYRTTTKEKKQGRKLGYTLSLVLLLMILMAKLLFVQYCPPPPFCYFLLSGTNILLSSVLPHTFSVANCGRQKQFPDSTVLKQHIPVRFVYFVYSNLYVSWHETRRQKMLERMNGNILQI
jgi:hypothetical protein